MVDVIGDELFMTWESQVRQHPKVGRPGITYSTPEIDIAYGSELPDGRRAIFSTHVDVLLFRNGKGHVVGILYHYPFDCDLEAKGNVNIFVRPDRRRRGIGSRLLREADARFDLNLDQQKYTTGGLALVKRNFPGWVGDEREG